MTIPEDLGSLSERELEVLKLVSTGATNQQIARDLVISPNTVKVHLRNIFEKLGVQSRTEATMEAVRRGWVTVPGEAFAPVPAASEDEVEPELQPIPLPELMPHAPVRRPVARWQYAAGLLALLLAVLGMVAPSWRRTSSEAATLTAFSDLGRAQSTAPERIVTQRWNAGAPLPQQRSRLALTSDGTRLYAIGGETPDGVTGDLTVFDPSTNGWLPLAAKPTPVANIAASFLDGRIYVPGGSTPGGGVSDVFEIYDPVTDRWETGPSLPRPLTAYASVAWNGKLYLFGGWSEQSLRTETLIFDPSSQAWSEGPPLPGPRAFSGATVLKDVFYVVGGQDSRSNLTDVLAYDPSSNEMGSRAWTEKASLNQPRAGLAVVGVGAQVFALGGGWDGSEAYNEQYDTRLDAWSRLGTPIPGEWRNLAAAPLNNKIYVVGGWSGTYLDIHEQYVALILQLIPLTGAG